MKTEPIPVSTLPGPPLPYSDTCSAPHRISYHAVPSSCTRDQVYILFPPFPNLSVARGKDIYCCVCGFIPWFLLVFWLTHTELGGGGLLLTEKCEGEGGEEKWRRNFLSLDLLGDVFFGGGGWM